MEGIKLSAATKVTHRTPVVECYSCTHKINIRSIVLLFLKRLNQKMLALKKANSCDGNNSPHTSHRPAFFFFFFFWGGGGGEGGRGEVYA